MTKKILILLLTTMSSLAAVAQCPITINSFPYNEGFEFSGGNWSSGGLYDDWAWGSPNKSLITAAGGGSKCWMTGGLNGSFYNLGQRSYLLSPCFDFTSIQNPHIQFKIWWETENLYDGATFQYSLNNGATWTNVGSVNDPVNCLNANWFNQSNILALNSLASPYHGWGGTTLPTTGNCQGGGGSGGWVNARHSMPYLAGQPNVQFRFAFGAGTQCNDYDGVAIDDISIDESLGWISVAPNNISCNGNNSGSINALASGSGVITYHLAPVNITNTNGAFNSLYAGSYTVTAMDANGCSISSSVTLVEPSPIQFVSISKQDLNCFNDGSGQIQVQYSGGVGGLTYYLYPGGSTSVSGTFSGVSAATYTVVALDGSGCSKSTVVTLNQPPQIILQEPGIIAPGCNPNNDGQIQVNASGGAGVLSYSIGGGFVNSPAFTGLTAGTYTIVVKDAGGCTVSTTAVLLNINAPVFSDISVTHESCFGKKDAAVNVTATGTAPISMYTLSPGNVSVATGIFTNLSAAIYTITAVDQNSCTNTVTITIHSPSPIEIVERRYTSNGCGSAPDAHIYITAAGGAGTFSYSAEPGNLQSTNGQFEHINTSGLYTITVTDANACTQTTTIHIEERICCDELYLPNAFTPNGDGLNEEFRILNTKAIELHEFLVYNRWGLLVFRAQNINDSWDGKRFGVVCDIGDYHYYIRYTCLSTGKEHRTKGDVILVR